MSWFNRKKKQSRQEKFGLEQVQQIATLTSLAKKGLLFFDSVKKQVVISDTLAALFLGSNERWTGFLSNVQMWFVYQASATVWKRVFAEAETRAVREARKKFAMLTALQEQTIRQQARDGIDVASMPSPQLEPYDFIISTDIRDGREPRVIAVGRWEDGHFDMTPIEEVKKATKE